LAWHKPFIIILLIIKHIVTRTHLLLVPAAILAMTEFLNRGSWADVWHWANSGFPPLLLNYLLLLGLYWLTIAIVGGARTAYWLFAIVVLGLSIISGVKLKIWAAPLFPWDPRYSSDFSNIVRAVPAYLDADAWTGLGLFVALSLLLVQWIPWMNRRCRWPEQIVIGLVALLVLTSVYMDKPVSLSDRFTVETTPWDPMDSYMTNGFMLSSMLNLGLSNGEVPPGYSREKIAELVDGQNGERAISAVSSGVLAGDTTADGKTANDSSSAPITATSTRDPNVIVILSEAFWDPTVMPGVTFSPDPIPFLHSLQQSYPGGWLLSPQFGGGTANVEFEVLTGNSMRFLVDGAIAYIDDVNRGMDSMASILRRQGYSTTAINPLDNWFFTSRKTYRNFGFSRFISSEFIPQNYEGLFLSDQEVARQIIGQTGSSPGPDFVFANTMENHWPYYPGKFDENTIRVDGDFSEDSKGTLETYAQGISYADGMLKTLVDHYTATGEPTMIVFFGDHLPSLGDDYEVFKDTKYISGDDDPDFLMKMYRTPFVVWNNFLPQKKENLFMSPSFLGAYALHQAGKQGGYYTDFLYKMWQRIPVIPPASSWEEWGIQESDVADYQMLQHDIVHGERYGYQMTGISDRIVDPDFHVGYDAQMELESVTPEELIITTEGKTEPPNGGAYITAKGQNFAPSSVIVVSGTPLPTTFVDSGTLTATVPKRVYRLPGTLQVAVEVIDAKNVVIARSNSVEITAD
jgi:phosphoglycerol transferase MdoB-like AlkP superfamily enzyme